jgi:hypothetical protein
LCYVCTMRQVLNLLATVVVAVVEAVSSNDQ